MPIFVLKTSKLVSDVESVTGSAYHSTFTAIFVSNTHHSCQQQIVNKIPQPRVASPLLYLLKTYSLENVKNAIKNVNLVAIFWTNTM